MATNWDLRAFLDGQKDLNEAEKKLCYQLLDEQGFSAADKKNAFFNLNNADLKDAGIKQISTRKVLLLAIEGAAAGGLGSAAGPVPKTVAVVHVVVTPGEDKEVVDKVTFKNQASVKEFLRGANTLGFVRVPDDQAEEGEETVLIRDISDLVEGQHYHMRFEGQSHSLTSIRQELMHLGQGREDETGQAVLLDAQRQDKTCVLDPSLRVLQNSKGQAEVEFDAVIMCESQAIVLELKTNYTGANMVTESATKAQLVAQKSSDVVYAGTQYKQFSGKKVVPAFMAECVAAPREANLLHTSQTHGVKLYRRNGKSISPWASMTPLKRAAARPVALRWVVLHSFWDGGSCEGSGGDSADDYNTDYNNDCGASADVSAAVGGGGTIELDAWARLGIMVELWDTLVPEAVHWGW
ncbi:hypothetical protein TSOC_006589 [Tetrabaena socialis]|uniref:Uncharacterized protein n=1 Tax=Tetrabaena socialis TaxID=47790 RepID=A0A2J8A388_9CHLO|nr:hypothetical protein TSOC_006589 [Tetrabaena socialis]|eukprot:PNH06985.1 hypothetical protein TSOC_006589 [Tetrabaena socialis]